MLPSNVSRDILGGDDLSTDSGELRLQVPDNYRDLIPHAYLVAEALGIGEIQTCYQSILVQLDDASTVYDINSLEPSSGNSISIVWHLENVFKVFTEFENTITWGENNVGQSISRPYLSIFSWAVKSPSQDLNQVRNTLNSLNGSSRTMRVKTVAMDSWSGSPSSELFPTRADYNAAIVDSLERFHRFTKSDPVAFQTISSLLEVQFSNMKLELLRSDENVLTSETNPKSVMLKRDISDLGEIANLLNNLVILGLSQSLEINEELRETIHGRSSIIDKRYIESRQNSLIDDSLDLFGELMNDYRRPVTITLLDFDIGPNGPEPIVKVNRDGIELGEAKLALIDERRSATFADVKVIYHSHHTFGSTTPPASSLDHQAFRLIVTDADISDDSKRALQEVPGQVFISNRTEGYVVPLTLIDKALETKDIEVFSYRNKLFDRIQQLERVTTEIRSQETFDGESLSFVDRILEEGEQVLELAVNARDEVDLRDPNRSPFNSPPTVRNLISDISISVDQPYYVRDLTTHPIVFADANANDQRLSYTVSSGNEAIARAETIGRILRIIPVNTGSTKIISSASDGHGGEPTTVEFTINIADNNTTQSISLNENWHIVSSYVTPTDPDIETIFQPLINGRSLDKIQDQRGRALVKLRGNWHNSIGPMRAGRGYLIKVNTQTSLTLQGSPITLPLPVPLDPGWNIVGYPMAEFQSSISFFQQLINEGSLIKVQDDSGQALERVRNFNDNEFSAVRAGEGYWVKVNKPTTFVISQPSAGKIVADPILPPKPTHYRLPYIGNPYMPMNLYITRESLDQLGLVENDEIAVDKRQLFFRSSDN